MATLSRQTRSNQVQHDISGPPDDYKSAIIRYRSSRGEGGDFTQNGLDQAFGAGRRSDQHSIDPVRSEDLALTIDGLDDSVREEDSLIATVKLHSLYGVILIRLDSQR